MDHLIKALARDKRVRVYIINSTNTLNTAINKHDLWPSAASVLGKTMTIGLIMGAMLKGQEATTIKIDGNGPIGSVIVDTNAKGHVRGYVNNPHVHFSKKSSLDDITTLGNNGYIDVIKDLKMKDLYSSTIPIQTGDLAKDFTYYFAHSEQTPSLTSLGVIMKEDNTADVCGGLVVQLMPDAKEEDIVFLESKTSLLSKFSQLLTEYNIEEILKLLFEDDYTILENMPVEFYCDCNRSKFQRGIASLGKEEIQDIIDTVGHAEVVCHYCKEQYVYNEQDLKDIKKGLKK